MPISSVAAGTYAAVQKLAPVAKPEAGKITQDPETQDFGALVKESLQAVTDSAGAADREIGRVASGQSDLINIVTAVAESETAMQTLVSVRDKVIAAYEDVMRMTI